MPTASLLAALLLSGSSECPAGCPTADYLYGELTQGLAWTWHEAALLAGPDQAADTLLTVDGATCVRITGDPAGWSTWRGIRTPFYPAALATGASFEGYVSGNDLALAALETDGGILVMCALTGRDEPGDGSFSASALAFDSSGMLLDSIGAVLPPRSGSGVPDTYHYIVDMREADVSGLDCLESGMLLEAWYEACGRLSTTQLIAWDGAGLVPGPSTGSISEAGLFHHFENLVLPADPGGVPNAILLASYDDEWVDSLGTCAPTGTDTTVLRWTGSAFVEE